MEKPAGKKAPVAGADHGRASCRQVWRSCKTLRRFDPQQGRRQNGTMVARVKTGEPDVKLPMPNTEVLQQLMTALNALLPAAPK